MTAKAGHNMKSRYGVNAPNPTAAIATTRTGVKQHSATSAVPMSDAYKGFFDGFFAGSFIQ